MGGSIAGLLQFLVTFSDLDFLSHFYKMASKCDVLDTLHFSDSSYIKADLANILECISKLALQAHCGHRQKAVSFLPSWGEVTSEGPFEIQLRQDRFANP